MSYQQQLQYFLLFIYLLSVSLHCNSSYFSLFPRALKAVPDRNSQRFVEVPERPHVGGTHKEQSISVITSVSLLVCQAAQVHRVTRPWPMFFLYLHPLMFLFRPHPAFHTLPPQSIQTPASQFSGVTNEAIQSYVVHQTCLLIP